MSAEHQDQFSLDLVTELAQRLAAYLLECDQEHWQDTRVVEMLARAATLLESDGRQVPTLILDVLRKVADAGRPIGVN